MEDLAPSPDPQNAEDLMRPPAPATPGYQLEQLIEDAEQHAPLPVQSSDADEPSSRIEASEQASDESDPTEVSLEDTIRKYIPDNSDLANSLERRETFACLLGDGIESKTGERSDLNKINDFLGQADARGRQSLLVVQDANIHWAKALCAKYPDTLSPESLAGHMIRFDKFQFTNSIDDAIQSYLWGHYPDADFNVTPEGRFMSISTREMFEDEENQFNLDFVVGSHHGDASTHIKSVDTRGIFEDKENQFNLDFIVGSYHGDESTHINSVDTRRRYRRTLLGRSDVFEKDEQKNWRRISVRLSCFRLAADFHMILIDSTPTPQGLPRRIGWPAVEYKPRTTQIDSPFGGELRLLSKPAERDLSTLESGVVLDYIIAPFQPALTGHGHTLQSVFDPQVLPFTEYEKPSQRGQRRAQIFFWLLTETSWRRLVAHLEMKLHDLQREATTIAGDQAFERLTDLRRQLAGAYGMLAKAQDMATREFKDEFLSWNVRGKKVSAEAFWSEERARPKAVGVIKASSIDIRDLPQLLDELLERMQTMTRSVNEEIQMVIGSVQVEDARVMRRQTEWTVVLAVLAAIYLPLTLVTGLFGMNITEIDAGPTAPDSSSVVKVWGVVFGATMGSVFVYAVVRYVLRYRRVGRLSLWKTMRKIGDGSLHRRLLAFKDRVRDWWLYKNIRQFREKMREWDEEAQKMDKME